VPDEIRQAIAKIEGRPFEAPVRNIS
jgi:hypothetical protein